ncbi:MAG: hypothetical protein HEQ34_11730 [Sphingorhabdus sp.]|uniref:hypothetical protein n=1 Tax=Sphingorhabdus sp. TaxID=1902408 RepID=UPI0025E535AF|nr:hypothetical protein [Sphingorhabdus sp.]MCO4092609.1 hypothetical protein [Sphingorhabdus sp.]
MKIVERVCVFAIKWISWVYHLFLKWAAAMFRLGLQSRQTAYGPIQVIIMRLVPSSPLRQLLGDRHHLLNDDNWVESRQAVFEKNTLPIADLVLIKLLSEWRQ